MDKYKKWYDSIMTTAKNSPRRKHQGTYYEQHHIVPVSLGGGNSASNLVLLTAREHFIAHLLLMKFSVGVAKYKMATAFICMQMSPFVDKRFTSRSFELHKEEAVEAIKAHGPCNMPVTVKGVEYPSKNEARRQLNTTHFSIERCLEDPNYIPRSRELVVQGIKYASINAIKESLGVSYYVAKKMVDDPNYKCTTFNKKKPVTFRGVTYVSLRAAGKALGVHRKKVLEYISNDGNLNSHTNLPRSVLIDKVYYASITEASKALGVSTTTVRRRIKQGMYPQP